MVRKTAVRAAAVAALMWGAMAFPATASAQTGLPTTVSGLLCPPVTEIAKLTTPLDGGLIGNNLASLVCSAGLLEYKVYTRFKRPNGTTLTREHSATVGLPTLLNVDDDLLPDMVATISLTSPNTAGLVIERFFGEFAQMPVAVEAALRDPTGGLLGREYVAFGMDARADRAPQRFDLSTPIDTILRPTPNFMFSVAQNRAGAEKVALTGGIFDGTLANRENPAELRIDYGKSPDGSFVAVGAGGDDVNALVTTNRPGPTSLSGRLVDGADESRFNADLRDMPSWFQVRVDQRDGVAAQLSSSAPIAQIDGSFEQRRNGQLREKSLVDLDGVPVGVGVAFAEGRGTLSTSGGPIGQLRVGTANGEPKFLPGENAYALIDDDGTVDSVSAALPGVRNASFTLGEAPQLSAEIRSTPFKLRMREPGRTLSADVLDLPSRFDLGVDLEAGRISYDGHGAGIGRITLDGDGTVPFFGRATKLRGTIEGIPASMDAVLDLSDGSGEFRVDGGGAIGSIELLASNGPDGLPAGSGQGVIYRDVPGGAFHVAARIRDLRRVAFSGGDALALETHTAGGPFSLVAETDDLRADGAIEDLPAKARITADLASGGRVTFRGRTAGDAPAGIDRLRLDVVTDSALVDRADHLRAHLEGIPADVELGIAQEAGTVDVSASQPIGLIEIVAANRAPTAADLPAGDEQGARYVDLTGGEFVVGARIRELKRLAATLGTPLSLTAETAGGPFGLDVRTDDLAATGRIEDLPAKLTAGVDLDAGKLTVTGRTASGEPQRIDRITLDLDSSQPVFGRASDVRATIEDIPSDLVLDIAQAGDGARIEGNETIGLIELVAANREPDAGDLPAGGEQGAKFTDLDDGEFVLAARLRNLKKLAGSFADTRAALSTITEGGPFGIRVTTDDLRAHARVEDLPAQLDVGFDLEAGRVTVDGRDAGGAPQRVDRLRVDLDADDPLFGRATDVHGLLEGIPSGLTLDLAQTGTGVNVSTNEPIDLIELVARDGDVADPAAFLPAGGAQGAIYRDTASAYQLATRVRRLSRLEADLSGTVALRAVTAGGPFLVLADAGGVRADAQLLDLPADVELGFDPDAGTFRYVGKDAGGAPAGIALATLAVQSDQPLFGRATEVSARIEQLAPEVNLSLETEGTAPAATVEASQPIERLELLASDGGATTFPAPLDDPGTQGVIMRDRAGQPFVVALRVLALERVAMTLGDDIGVEARTAGSRFVVDADTDDFGLAAQIADLPADARLTVGLADGRVVFTGRDAAGNPEGIDLLTLEGRLGTPVLGRADRLRARIEALPSDVELGFSEESGQASLHANQPVGLIELFGWQNGEAEPVLAADQGALLHDRPSEPFQLAARVRQLEELTVDFAEAVSLRTKTAGGLFTADVRTETLTAQATIDQLPSELTLDLDLDSGVLSYDGSAPIHRIFASIDSADPVFLGATAFEADLLEVPQSFEIALGTEADNIHLAADNPIGQIDLRARSANRAFPSLPAGEAGAVLKTTDGELELALRVFQLEALDVTLDPIALDAKMAGGRKFTVDAEIESAETPGEVLSLDAVIDQLPSQVKLALEDVPAPTGGSRLVLEGNAPIGFVRLAAGGLALLPGADEVVAEINDLPQKLTVALPETGSLARIEGRNAANALTPIGQIRLAASDGSKPLPAFVADAQYQSNPGNSAFRDRLEFDNSPGSTAVVLRLTAPKVIDVKLDPIALTLEQDGARTRPIAIDARIPNSTAGQPATTVTGLFNKPSARTVLGVTVAPGQPTRLNFENAAAVGSLTLNAANLGAIPQANFSLANIPTRLNVCLNTDSTCRRGDRLPSALSTYSGTGRTPTQTGTAGGENRPYPALVSMNFDDQGTSGTSSAISSMVTLNATIKLNPTDPPIQITNLRFHSMSMDLGQHPTNPSFSFLGSDVPRIYMFIDSLNVPFVINEIKYPPTIESFKIGTDGSPARADRRLVWLPGTRCTAIAFGACVPPPLLDSRSAGSLQCAGQRSLTVKLLGLNINLLNFLGLQILPVCSD